MEEKLGSAFEYVNRYINIINSEVYLLDVKRLKNFKYLESRQSIYIIFRQPKKNEKIVTFYVGKTSQTIVKRFKDHLSNIKIRIEGKKDWNTKYTWMSQVIGSGGKLVIVEVNKVQSSKIYMFEQKWIVYLRKCGFKLLNKVNTKYYNSKNIKI